MKKVLKVIFIVIFLGVIGAIGYYNWKNNCKFFEASFTTLATLVVAVIVSFLLVQWKTDQRRQHEKLDDLLYKIQNYIGEESFVMGGDYARGNLILHRTIANKIRFIKKQKICKEVSIEIKKIEDNFKRFRDLYGDNYTNEDDMKSNYDALKNYVLLIDDSCDKIHMILL